jgi:hypothetical protein
MLSHLISRFGFMRRVDGKINRQDLTMATDTKSHVVVASTPTPTDPESNNPEHNVSTWERIREVIWDGRRSKEERKLVQRLDLFLLSDLSLIIAGCTCLHRLQVLGNIRILYQTTRFEQYQYVQLSVWQETKLLNEMC